jgi:hypothetical protein
MTNSSEIDLGFEDSSGAFTIVALRFQLDSVSRSATINTATIQFVAAQSDAGALNLVIDAHKSPNAPARDESRLDDIATRVRTSAQVKWSIAAWNGGEAELAQRTPDLAPILSEVISQPEWIAGAYVLIVLTEPTHSGFSRQAHRSANITLSLDYSGKSVLIFS